MGEQVFVRNIEVYVLAYHLVHLRFRQFLTMTRNLLANTKQFIVSLLIDQSFPLSKKPSTRIVYLCSFVYFNFTQKKRIFIILDICTIYYHMQRGITSSIVHKFLYFKN